MHKAMIRQLQANPSESHLFNRQYVCLVNAGSLDCADIWWQSLYYKMQMMNFCLSSHKKACYDNFFPTWLSSNEKIQIKNHFEK